MSAKPGFLGTGWAFPPRFTAGGADVAMVSGPDDIRQSLEILFATHAAERPFQEDFGCDLRQFLYEAVDQRLVSSLTRMITDAVLHHEPRIVLHGVDLDTDEAASGLLLIRLDYTIRGTNSRYNLVYPFYLTEAAVASG